MDPGRAAAWPPPPTGALSEAEYAFWRQGVPAPSEEGERIVLRTSSADMAVMDPGQVRELGDLLAALPAEADGGGRASEAAADFLGIARRAEDGTRSRNCRPMAPSCSAR
jgi:hypothetical protein